MDSAALIAELNDAVAHGTVDQRAKILHRITKLFVVASAGYSDEQIELFDDVLMRVAATIELSARAVLACLLAGPSARADITFCNQFPHLVYVAMAYPQNGGSWISRGWISLKTGECSLFDPALRVKTFYYRGESAAYRGASGKKVKKQLGFRQEFRDPGGRQLQLLGCPAEGARFESGRLHPCQGNERGCDFRHGHFQCRWQWVERHDKITLPGRMRLNW
jgi:uncharacterized membrane protein